MELTHDLQMDLHRRMVRIRLFEEAAGRLAEAAKLPGFLHLYVGEEAVASGVCATLHDDDHITSTHRGHGHLVAKGGDFNRMMAELMGKSGGYCKGKGGSMHISDLSLGMLGANGIVGAGSPIAVGAAFANKYRKRGQVSVAFFGDGATNIGAFHEAANMACALHLPIVFVCENNEYSMGTPLSRTLANQDVTARADGYGMAKDRFFVEDVFQVRDRLGAAIERARTEKTPTLIEVRTYRFRGHSMSDPGKYRTPLELEEHKKKDPVYTSRKQLADAGESAALDEIDASVEAEIADAIKFAEESAEPQPDILEEATYKGAFAR